MKIHLPNSAHLQNIDGFIRDFDPNTPDDLTLTMHERWVSVHPIVLAMSACAGVTARHRGGQVSATISNIGSLPYLIRMGLFRHLNVDPGRDIKEHEESGRFIPLTQVVTSTDLKEVIDNIVPLLHASIAVADPIRYVFSEMIRNVFEHSHSSVGAFVCAQYYKDTERISIGIADAGIGILKSMQRSHSVETSKEAIKLALQPGVTGTTSRIGGNAFNAGAGLFFIKSIAALSRNFFVLYSGDAAFKLLRGPDKEVPRLHADPDEDSHKFLSTVPSWAGTVVGIDISVKEGSQFSDLLGTIRKAYFIDKDAKKKAFYKKIRFTK